MKVLKLDRGLTALQRGQVHGEAFASDIRDLAEIRKNLICRAWGLKSAEKVLQKAELHLGILSDYDLDLFQEFQGIAQGSGLSETELLILNHYTDLRDLGNFEKALEEGCSILQVRYGQEALLGQTWDMHATAEPHVLMLYLPDEGVWTLTINGCLGLCGLSRSGLAVAINNLVLSDAKIGVSWPTLVRKMLRAKTVIEAERVLHSTMVGSGHHYALMDALSCRAWETSGSQAALVNDGSLSPYVHTNHCLSEALLPFSEIAPSSTTHHRFLQACELLKHNPQPTADELWEMMACKVDFPNSLFTDRSSPEDPHGVATCARVLMDCNRGEILGRAATDLDQSPMKFEWT